MNPAARKKQSPTRPDSTKPKTQKRTSSVRTELTRLVFLVLSVYSLTCVLFTDSTGDLGVLVRNALLGLFGPIGALAIPTTLSLLLFFGRALKLKGVIKSKIFCSMAAILSLISAVHLIFEGIPQASNAVDIVSDLWVNAKEGNGGGLIGGLIALGAGKAVGRGFAVVILLFLTALSLSFAVGFSAFGVWSALGDLLCIERTPKSEKPKKEKKDKKQKKSPKRQDAASEFSALLKHADDGTNFGSADADILKEDAGDPNGLPYETDDQHYQVYRDGDEEDQRYTDDIRVDDPDDLEKEDIQEDPPYEPDYTDEPDEPEEPEETFDTFDTFDPLKTEENPSKTEEAPVDKEEKAEGDTLDPDDNDNDDGDGDPFDPQPVIKPKRFGRLVGKRNPAPAKGGTEPEPPDENNGDGAEEEDNTPRWKEGNKYVYPHSDLLFPIPEERGISDEEAQAISEKIIRKFKTFKINATIRRYVIGPAFTRYEIIPGEGVRIKDILGQIKDIQLELAAGELRVEAPIPNVPAIGIEVPNKKVTMVPFRSLVESPAFAKAKSKITVCVGKNVTGDVVLMDIDDMPHTLIAGQTKSGKSVAMNCMLLSLIFRVTPDEVKLLLIDPKQVEFNVYGKIPHLVAPVIVDPVKAAAALSWAADEMDRRYSLMEKCNARNRDEYLRVTANKPDKEVFPQMIIVIDEYADLVIKARELRNNIEDNVSRLGGKGRACGIHLLIGTQRPSADVITGIIKSNIPARISFKVAGSTEAGIIGTKGADKLLGRGDLLYLPTGGALTRAQGAYVDVVEISNVINYLIENNGEAYFDPDFLELLAEKENEIRPVKKGTSSQNKDTDIKDKTNDPYLLNAIEISVNMQKISTSALQRHLSIGYSRAAKLLDAMESLEIIEPQNGSKARKVLMTKEEFINWVRDNDLDLDS